MIGYKKGQKLTSSAGIQYYQFVVLDGELGEPLVVFQSCNDGDEVPEMEEEEMTEGRGRGKEIVRVRKRWRSKGGRSRSSSSPVLQVDEVLQVELSGVLAQVDGVHILQEAT